MQSGATFTNNASPGGGVNKFSAAKVDGSTMPAWMSKASNKLSYSCTTDRGDNATRISTPVPLRCGPTIRYATCAVSTSNGIDFLSFHRINVSCSSAFLEGFSAVTNAIRAVSSGTTTAISDPLNRTCDSSCRTTGRIASTLVSIGRFAAALSTAALRLEFTPATITCLDVSSQAHNGACGLNSSVIVSTKFLLNECDLIDFLQCGRAGKDFRESRFTQEGHPFIVSGALDFRCWPSLDDHFANVVGQVQQLMNCGASPESRSIAFQTALTFVKRKVTILIGGQAGLHQHLVRILRYLFAIRANDSHEALGKNAIQG